MGPPGMPELKVHPFADTFPMMSAEELTELAADIKKNGLRYSLTLDAAGEWLVDGRNRAKACQIAGVEPRYEHLPEGVDLIAYILSVNVERRHLNVGQRAVAVALAHPEAGKAGRRKNGSGPEPFYSGDVSKTRLSYAREIVAHADLAQRVMAGALPFEHALAEARWRVQNAEQAASLLRKLQFAYPDLAEQVTAGERSLYSAVREQEKREAAMAVEHRKRRTETLAAGRLFVAGLRNGLRHDAAFRGLLIHEFGDVSLLDQWIEQLAA
jgi:ParB-like chromosome segregation protein Spo0J